MVYIYKGEGVFLRTTQHTTEEKKGG